MSGNVHNLQIEEETLRRILMKSSSDMPLHGGGGGGTSGGMEARVAKLESDVQHILTAVSEIKASQGATGKDLSDLKVATARMETSVSNLPSKDDISKTIKDWLLLIGGAVTILNLAGLIVARYLPAAS